MLGFSAISSTAISGIGRPARKVASLATLAGVTLITSGTRIGSATASQTVGGITQFTGTGYLFNAPAQQLQPLKQSAAVQVYTAARSPGTLQGIKQAAVLQRASLVSQHATLGGVSQATEGSVFWNLPNCGWINLLGDSLDAFLRHLPSGWAWIAWRWPGKKAFKLASAIASVFDDAMASLCNLSRELDPRTTEAMLPEWEAALSLPDACLPVAVTIEERRRNIWFRLTKKRWRSADDFKRLAAMFGLKIDVTPGWYVQKPTLYQACYPKRYDLYPRLGRFRVYIDITNVKFPGYNYGDPDRGPGYPIPYGYSNDNINAFMCLINKVKPANVVVLWNQFPTGLPCVLPPESVPSLDFSKVDDSQYIPIAA